MKVIRARNVNSALPEALRALALEGVRRESRNGPVTMFREPVTTVYERPLERVVFWAERDANPFFHLMESLWMLGGRNDVEFVAQFVGRMAQYSDDGATFHGAYGYRWRHHFFEDQLPKIIAALRENADDRRQVLSMWDADADLGRKGKDLPCNLQAIFQIATDGRLDMTVTNRSNDLVWGAYGANAVHFSYLQEYVASCVGVPVGIYRQVSANFHMYDSVIDQCAPMVSYAAEPPAPAVLGPYETGVVNTFPLMSVDQKTWDEDLAVFLSNPLAVGFRDAFFRRVAVPMYRAHSAFRNHELRLYRFDKAQEILQDVYATDWRLAAQEWIERRRVSFLRAQDGGPRYDG